MKYSVARIGQLINVMNEADEIASFCERKAVDLRIVADRTNNRSTKCRYLTLSNKQYNNRDKYSNFANKISKKLREQLSVTEEEK